MMRRDPVAWRRAGLMICRVVTTTIAAGLACACNLGSAATTDAAISDDAAVATVDGTPIAAAELRMFVAQARGGVVEQFSARYGARVDGRFWSTRFGGERPADLLRDAALALAVRSKLVQILMRDHGLLDDVSLRGQRTRLARENLRRREALQTGQPIYGPQQYGEREYIDYVISNGVIALKERLPGLAGDDAELAKDYEATKNSSCQHVEHGGEVGPSTSAARTRARAPTLQGCPPFAQVKRMLQYRHIERAFDALVHDLVARADVQIDRRVYDRVSVE